MKRAVTDGGPTAPNSEKPEIIENLFTFLRLVSSDEVNKHYEDTWNNCTIKYGDLKKQLAEDINLAIAPIRTRIEMIEKDEAFLRKVTSEGAEQARESARKTLSAVREIVGFKSF